VGRPPDRTINLQYQLERYPWQLALAATLYAGKDEACFKCARDPTNTHFIKCITAGYGGILKLYTFCWKERFLAYLISLLHVHELYGVGYVLLFVGDGLGIMGQKDGVCFSLGL